MAAPDWSQCLAVESVPDEAVGRNRWRIVKAVRTLFVAAVNGAVLGVGAQPG